MSTEQKPLNPNAQKWVAALRSGDFKQGRGALFCIRENSFCCLGVACELYRREVGINVWVKGHYRGYGDTQVTLPERVKRWLGIGKYGCGVLMRQNDRGKSFDEIADLIESQPPRLFMETAQ